MLRYLVSVDVRLFAIVNGVAPRAVLQFTAVTFPETIIATSHSTVEALFDVVTGAAHFPTAFFVSTNSTKCRVCSAM